jgi:coenzyme F420-0:L-glutamate ligase/coenzyme F420-1:gamma-L-glutamate ligase
MNLQILPVQGIGDVTAGDDLAEMITGAAPWLTDGDVLVVTSKIVSKAEGRLVEVPADGAEREEARQRVLADQTARVVARRGPTTIVQTHHGFVMAAAGIDASNVDKTHLVLLPEDPDASARKLRADLRERGLNVAVVVSDTMGRAWRNGLTDVALGAAGIDALLDHRGQLDPYGNELSLTQMAVIDELSAAAELVKGKCDRVPVAVVRGYGRLTADDGPGARVLIRDAAEDMFGLGTAEARAEGLAEAARMPVDAPRVVPVDGPARDKASSIAWNLINESPLPLVRIEFPAEDECRLKLFPASSEPADLVRLGAEAQRLRAAFAAAGLATAIEVDDLGEITLTYGALG